MKDMSINDMKEERIGGEEVFSGKILKVNLDQVRLPGGKTGMRVVVHHPGAVAIVAVQEDKILMVRQYRYAVGQDLLEIPAGKLDPQEEPFHCAERELREETGYRGELTSLGKIYTTPGFTDEVIHLFLARNLIWDPLSPDEDEVLQVESLPWTEAVRRAEQGEFLDAKTIVSIIRAKNEMES